MKKFITFIAFLTLFLITSPAIASERQVSKGTVVEIVAVGENILLDDLTTTTQSIRVLLEDGPNKGETILMDNDYIPLREGESIYVSFNPENEVTPYSLFEINRMPIVLVLLGIFLFLIFIFGGLQGVRGLVSLAGSLVLIIFVLLPGILSGISPIVASLSVASVIIIFGSYVTHGFNRTTTSAVFGMILAVLVSGLLAYISVDAARLTGMAEEETLYLSLNLGRDIDLLGLLFSGIIIGLLGVLYDTAISQAIAVEELLRVSPDKSKKFIYKRAIRIGREHIGALVDTLAIAYVGASLPLFLLFYSDTSVAHSISINNEIFIAEIIRTLVGSIGLVLAVPITTLLAVHMLSGRELGGSNHGHHHGHHH